MAKTPDFERITATITAGDIDHFFKSAAPEDFKQQVRVASDEQTKKRFVAGYLIRTNQVKPERLNPSLRKTAVKKKAVAAKKRPAVAAAAPAAETTQA